ncbi:hypothetical protein [Geomonas sp. Red32]|uniref:hypothetical protein n=1 Tax=Geomonas sp. Red32 TaxID=2912856 RepID=UPI00202CF8DA|nr:hypothetical protein [Geomonas sp. Red32]
MRIPDLCSRDHHRTMGPRAVVCQEMAASRQEEHARPTVAATGETLLRSPSPPSIPPVVTGRSTALLLPSEPPPSARPTSSP